ncbi:MULTISPECIES: dihydrofolate reductase family protein [unclassified Hahella]|uniref:dihydrofolate reductase family protein n=1 Tax=unclassified Hahella TaxID=2624107 RepID=UPI001C1EFB86|nr:MULTISPECIES: dihydrofolate reductase family protein [unclassified Hahella]MBU6950085.1 dihydrofolate reductase family protein [Hahella sp. HN01]MDG9671153.1 dihydrofolate reductase family protein [Hahella sp. CR1]
MEIVYYVAASLDGYIADLQGKVDWLASVADENEDYGYETFYNGVDALVMGSKTYLKVLELGAWPYQGKPVWVFSRQEDLKLAPGVERCAGDPSTLVAHFRALDYKRIWLVGGGELLASFQEEDLVDEYIISYVPVLLGQGIPLFPPVDACARLDFQLAETFSSGLVQMRYKRICD